MNKTFWALAYFQFVAQIHTLPYNLISFLCGKRPLFFWHPPPTKEEKYFAIKPSSENLIAIKPYFERMIHQTLLRPAVARSNILINAGPL